jgi:tetratricopeptide (TPR) repeat protein
LKENFDMRKRTAFIGAILSLIPLGQTLIIKTGVVLSTTGLLVTVPEKVNAESANFYDKQGFKEWNKNNFSAAIRNYNKAIEIEPNNALFYGKRGNCYYQLGDFYKAISDYNQSLNLNPNDKEIFLFRGMAKQKIGFIKGACSDWKMSSALGQEFAVETFSKYCK